MTNYVADTNITHEEWVVMMERWPQALTEMREAWDDYKNDLDLLEEHMSQLEWLVEMQAAATTAVKQIKNKELSIRLFKAHIRCFVPLARLYFKIKFS